MERVVFFVPHEDDELLLGGGLLVNLARDNHYDVSVVIATNGDYYPYEHTQRIKESVSALNQMGISTDHIIFLGYGDGWQGNHIYNSKPDELKKSAAEHTETYLDSSLKEWHFQRHQCHQPYTREGYLQDIEDVISTLLPSVIICVDMDPHQDHRCLSLLTEEALAAILKSNHSYRPILLKKYAYKDMMLGIQDFYEFPHKRTVDHTKGIWNPYFYWNDRISYKVPSDCNTVFLHTNLLYKTSRIFRTQDIWTEAPGFINDDITYWQRNVNNVMLDASITVSSGRKQFLNDFKLVDSTDIKNEDIDYSQECWRPDPSDSLRTIQTYFSNPIAIHAINLFFNCPEGLEGDYSIQILSKDGNKLTVQRNLSTKENFYLEKIDLDAIDAVQADFCFSGINGNLGIGEIEVLQAKQDVPFVQYLYEEKPAGNTALNSLIQGLLVAEKGIMKIQKALYYRTDSWRKKKAEYDRERKAS